MSGSNYTAGQILTAQELNASLNAKVDADDAQITGGQITGVSVVDITGTADSTSPVTGALVVAGGAGVGASLQVGGNVTVGGNEYINGTTQTVSPTTGALVVAGGVGIAKSLQVGSDANVAGNLTVVGSGTIDSSTASTSSTTGALVVVGGVGIGGAINAAGQISTAGQLKTSQTTDSTSTATGSLVTSGGAGIAKSLFVGGAATVSGQVNAAGTTDSTSSTTGALITAGGAGIAKSLFVGLNASVAGTLSVTGAANLSSTLSVTGIATFGNVDLASGGQIQFADGSTQSTAGAIDNEFTVNSTGGTVNVTSAQAVSNNIFKITGALTSNLIVVFPAKAKSLTVYNLTTGAFSVTVQASGQAPSVVAPSAQPIPVIIDTTGAYLSGSAASGIAFAAEFSDSTGLTLTTTHSGGLVTQTASGITTTAPVASTFTAGKGIAISNRSNGNNTLAFQGTDTHGIIPTTLYPGDVVFIVSNGSSGWDIGWYSGVTTPQVSGLVFSDGTKQGSAAAGKNKFINGTMDIDQRNNGTSKTITAGAALAYTVDRWYAYCTGANVTGQQVAGSGSSRFRYRFTGAAGVTGIGFGQRIEAANSYDLNGQTATLSADLANSLLTTVTWTAYYANSTDAFGTLASPTRTQIATGTFTVNSTVSRYSAQISIPSAATTGIEIVLSVGAQTSGTWTIGNLQLEAGSTATPMERRSFSNMLLLCQRYLFRIGSGSGVEWIGTGIIQSATQIIVGIPLPVKMRTKSPTLTTNNAVGTSAGLAVNGSSQLWTNNGDLVGAYQITASGATWTAGQAGAVYVNSGFFQLDCEL